MENLSFVLALWAYLLMAFVWPTLRVWRRTGVWPVVLTREAAPWQRLLGCLCVLLLLGLVGLGVLHVALGPERLGVWRLPAARVAGWLLIAAGGVLTVVAQRQMGVSWRVGIDDRPTELVTDGLFHWVRNPIFSGLLAFLGGVMMLSLAWWSIAVFALTTVGLRLQVGQEERHLVALHGARYLEYAARVGRFTPFTGRLRFWVPPSAEAVPRRGRWRVSCE